MQKLFEYNWQVRQDWFNWCSGVDRDELMRPRTGGLGYILPTLYHIVAVEYGWICGGIQERVIEIPAFGKSPAWSLCRISPPAAMRSWLRLSMAGRMSWKTGLWLILRMKGNASPIPTGK